MSDIKNWRLEYAKKIDKIDFMPIKSRAVMERLMSIFKDHIGVENRITIKKLFKKLYGINADDLTDLQGYMLLQIISSALTQMRHRTNCFVIRNGQNLWVVTNSDDYKLFWKQTKERIKGLNDMADKCNQAIRQKWYSQDFRFTSGRAIEAK